MSLGNWRLLNPTAGCRDLKTVNPSNAAASSLTGPVCEENYYHEYVNVYPQIDRNGLNLRYTMELGDHAEAYAMFNYYRVQTTGSGGTPYYFGGTTPPGGPDVVRASISPVVLPVYICPLSAGNPTCNATNGVLNPNNPFAAAGQAARLSYRLPMPREANSDAESFRYAAGITGSFGDDQVWDYSVEVVSGSVNMDLTRKGYPIPRRILNAVYNGSFNFVNPAANPQSMWDYIAPPVTTHNTSNVDQIQATLARPLVELAGGSLVAAVGAAWRREEVDAPSANDAKADPFERYLSVNTVAATGKRSVNSYFFEIDAPILDNLNVNLSGRYDDYSTGQANFLPKIGVQFKPIDMIKVRGTYSEGFRIPSFNEAYGAPTTGYITSKVDSTIPGGTAFLAAHGNNAYASTNYSLGLTATGFAGLDPEESKAYTLGVVFEPDTDLGFISVTIDYWHLKVNQLISDADYSPAINAYYQNNGVVNIPGLTVIPATPDVDFPNALPLLGFIQYSYENADSEIAEGIDVGASFRHDFDNFEFTSHLELSRLLELSKTIGGVKANYEGTLSPCDVTSCSGAPDWRATWVNSIVWNDFTFALTANYTGGYDNASVDYGAVPGDCSSALHASVYTYDDDTAFKCTHSAYVDWDFSATYRFNDSLQVYANIVNVFDDAPEFDPAQAYSLYGFNPAWELSGWRGRYFRLGVKYSL